HLIALLEEACGRKAQMDFQPMQPGDVPATYADISAIARDVGFAPATGIELEVPRFVSWYRDYHGIGKYAFATLGKVPRFGAISSALVCFSFERVQIGVISLWHNRLPQVGKMA